MEAKTGGIIAEVREFLGNLTLELPLLFSPTSALLSTASSPKSARRTLYRGREVTLRVVEREGISRSEVSEGPDGLTILRGGDRAAPHEVLREWLVDRAREAFVERAAYWAPRLEVRYERIAIRDQRSVWGSCSKAGNLNFNWRIVMAPPEVLDYLVIHELAHLREMNHSKSFWRIVASHCPGWRAQRSWLRDHSRRLKSAVRRSS